MPLQAQQIVTQACQTAKVPAWTTQGGQLLNMILSELCQTYDLAVAQQTLNTTFFSGTNGYATNTGSYYQWLPTNYLRPDKDDLFYIIQGVKYILIPCTLAQLNAKVETAGLNGYPEYFAVDTEPLSDGGAPIGYFWPPPAGSYALTMVYYSQMADIANPQSSATVPWFPNQSYLLRRLTGELMTISGDDRASRYLGGVDKDGFEGATALLDRYLKMKDDVQVPKQVTLDRRLFQNRWDKARNTKIIGW